MERVERVGAERQPFPHLEVGGQRVGEVAGMLQRCAGQVADALLRDVLGRGIDRREVGGGDRVAQVMRANTEAITVGLSSQADARSRPQLRHQPRLVEPSRRDLGAVVAYLGLEDLQPASPSLRDVEHLADDDDLFVGHEVCNATHRRSGFVPEGPVFEQIADRA